MITLLVGDVDSYLATEAAKIDPGAKLITSKNLQDLSSGVYYTSLGDLDSIAQLISLFEKADIIIYCPPKSWSDTKKNQQSLLQQQTEFYLLVYCSQKPVKNLPEPQERSTMLALADTRKCDQPQLWAAGCSFTHGTGVNQSDCYVDIIAKYTDRSISRLTQVGSSIEWAADQLLRSDLRANDIVIWGLTSHERFVYFSDNKIEHILPWYYQRHPEFNDIIKIDRLDEKNTIYKTITHIYQVINFCEKLRVKLILAGLLINVEKVLPYLQNCPHYLQLFTGYKDFLDLGTDNHHPGPATHKWYADRIVQHFKL